MEQVLQPIPTDEVSPPQQQRGRVNNILKINLYREFAAISSLPRLGHLTRLLLLSLLLVFPALIIHTASALSNASANLSESRVISAFLSPSLSAGAIDNLSKSLLAQNGINSIELVSETTALPIPDNTASISAGEKNANDKIILLELTPSKSLGVTGLVALATQIELQNGVEFVMVDFAQVEKQLSAAVTAEKLALIASVLGLLLASAIVTVITLRDLTHHTQHLQIMRQLGATESTTRRPFLLRAAILGIIAGTIGLIGASLLIQALPFLINVTSIYEVVSSTMFTGLQSIFLLVALTVCSLTIFFTKYFKYKSVS
ncbi:hypothetical protein AB833_29980 [Chromatiales bacterium (ex Bugula neritina AB1)]|nr:hypothetical protein AB833_29980 [Chromatiales bacterium (ex Bugula neritina AB1)]